MSLLDVPDVSGNARDSKLSAGVPFECAALPKLSQPHISYLRKIWSAGRPLSVAKLSALDLDLIVHGFIESTPATYGGYVMLTATRLGAVYLSDARQALIAAQRPHHELGARLAAHLQHKGFHTWENVEFRNPVRTLPRAWSCVRPDVFACLPVLSPEKASPAIYEVKVSRADFRADVARPEKRQAYRDLAEAVYYCCPEGMVAASEVPDGCGLLVEKAPGLFALAKRARSIKNFVLAGSTAMTLMVKRQVPLGRDGLIADGEGVEG